MSGIERVMELIHLTEHRSMFSPICKFCEEEKEVAALDHVMCDVQSMEREEVSDGE
jgi:hypothetical protein